ncbi:MAG: PEP-CTERM sorting domain-containing protein [Pacificimonas sp.]|jgi:MYXO-CTERM domain-containing protein|nr:PEP-CTERM sorting domain-containing protein [Pacificimonas sp.]
MYRKLVLASLFAAGMATQSGASVTKIGEDVSLHLTSGNCQYSSNACHFSTTFQAFDGSTQTVNVKATAWSINGGTGFDAGSHSRADINKYSYGLGATTTATNPDEIDNSPNHALDNEGHREYIALEFDTAVTAESVHLAVYNGSHGHGDADMSIIMGSVPTGLDSYLDPRAALTDWQSGFTVEEDYSGSFNNNSGRGSFAGWRTQDDFHFGEGDAGNVVIVAADLFGHGSYSDFFKVKTLEFDVYRSVTPQQDVPAPGAVLLFGLAALALARRRR